jgi:hypothetical protein
MDDNSFDFVYDYPLWLLADSGRVPMFAILDETKEKVLLVWSDRDAAAEFLETHRQILPPPVEGGYWLPVPINDALQLAGCIIDQLRFGMDSAMLDPRQFPVKNWRKFDLIEWASNTLRKLK